MSYNRSATVKYLSNCPPAVSCPDPYLSPVSWCPIARLILLILFLFTQSILNLFHKRLDFSILLRELIQIKFKLFLFRFIKICFLFFRSISITNFLVCLLLLLY